MNISSVGPNAALPSSPGASTAAVAAQNRQLVQAARVVNKHGAFGSNNEIVFFLDRTTHHAIMRVVDRTTNEVVMQVPPDYVLRLAEDLEQSSHHQSSA